LNNTGPLTTRLFNSPYLGGGLITLTDWSFNGYSIGTSANNVIIQSTGTSGIYWKADLAEASTAYTLFIAKQGLQHKLNAAETWELITPAIPNGASLTYHFGFSYKGTSQGSVPPMPISIGFGADTPTGNVLFGPVAGGAQGGFAGLQFTPTSTFGIQNITIIWSNGTTINTTMNIYLDNGGTPGALLGTAQWGGGTFTFNSPITVNATVVYWAVLEYVANNIFRVDYCGQVAAGFASSFATTLAGLGPGVGLPGNTNWTWQINGQSS